jgi:hypothetical protein
MARLNEFSVGQNVAVPLAAQGAANYAKEMGLVRPNRFDNVVINPPQAKRIAREYEDAPSYDKNAEPHFRAMAEETKRQFDFLTKPKSKGGLGVDVTVTKEDPYKKAASMMQDAARGKFSVLSSAQTGGHPYFTHDENNMFRAVHDFFGHAATGRGFDPSGEEAAFRSHYAMFSPKARPAMATETRGQNSALNFGKNPGEFPVQKVVTLPSAQLITPIGRRSQFLQAMNEAHLAHSKMLKGFNSGE